MPDELDSRLRPGRRDGTKSSSPTSKPSRRAWSPTAISSWRNTPTYATTSSHSSPTTTKWNG